MPQSLVKIWVHIVFATKHREPLIVSEYEPVIHAYLKKILNGKSSRVLAIGGMSDHVHILCSLPATLSISSLVKFLKGGASHWFNETYPSLTPLYWQNGYGAFSISPNNLDKVKTYVDRQKEIHTKRTLDQELTLIAKRYE